jgi:hypothetical protein
MISARFVYPAHVHSGRSFTNRRGPRLPGSGEPIATGSEALDGEPQ